MSVRKTMTAAALCTVALGSLIAQPAFAETLVDPSPQATTSAQTNASVLKPIASPTFSQAYQGSATIGFSSAISGQMKVVAPTGTRIVSVSGGGCSISGDGHIALCGTNETSWSGNRTVTFESDGASPPGNHTDGLVQIIHNGAIVDSTSLGANTLATLVLTNPVADAGAKATASLTFNKDIWGWIDVVAPAGTTFSRTGNSGNCTIAADGLTATCTGNNNGGPWRGTQKFVLDTPANAAPGTVYSGGRVTMHAGPGDPKTAAAAFSITVSNVVAKPTVNVNRNVLSGTGVVGGTVNVRNDKNEIVASAAVKPDGTWEAVVPFQGNGSKTLNVSQTYGTGTSDTVLATIDFGKGVQVTTPANGSTVTTQKTTFSGTGTVGATVEVNGSNKNVCTTTVKTDGTWTCDAPTTLPNGTFEFAVKQISGSIESSTTVSFARSYSATATPVKFTAPAPGSTVYTARPTFTGTGQPGAAIRVYGTSKTVATATVKADGTWSAPATMNLNGDYTLSVEQTPTNGAAATRDAVSFKVRTGAPANVVVTKPAQNSTITTKKVTYTGTGEPGSKIVINGTSKVIASATVRDNGTWEAIGDFDLPNGTFIFTVTQTEPNGDTKHTSLTFSVKAG